ncbi:MAG: OadG family protein [Eubacterium sp.]|nr:OadG family protein [Eubacterium sp.]
MGLITLETAIAANNSAGFTATVVIAGFFGVLLMLVILIIVLSLFSKTVSKTQRKKGVKKEEKAIMTQDLKVVSPFGNDGAPPQGASVQEQSQGISEEVVAAISAAVYMMEGEGAVIRSIAPAKAIRSNPIKTRNPWAMAAIAQNTKPF